MCKSLSRCFLINFKIKLSKLLSKEFWILFMEAKQQIFLHVINAIKLKKESKISIQLLYKSKIQKP
jgi:PIN domain nuclease of toxin-antitoxin system